MVNESKAILNFSNDQSDRYDNHSVQERKGSINSTAVQVKSPRAPRYQNETQSRCKSNFPLVTNKIQTFVERYAARVSDFELDEPSSTSEGSGSFIVDQRMDEAFGALGEMI